MIDIKDISGKLIKTVLITEGCKSVESLMDMNFVSLSWDDLTLIELPVGSNIEYKGNKYSLIEPYRPSFVNEAIYRYTPVFYDKISLWSKKPFFLITNDGEETDWSMTAYPGLFMDTLIKAIKKYTGEVYTYTIDSSIVQDRMETLSFQNVSIFQGANMIADVFKTEIWVEGSVIHLSKCIKGNPITLTVGENIGIPTITKNKEGYYTRFYGFGSTRNITQDYNSEFTNSLVNKRLTLDPILYPGGYIDTRTDLQPEEIFVKTLYFDDIYPSSTLTISDIRGDIKDVLDSSGQKVQIGIDEQGNPIYDKYTVWFFKIPGFEFKDSEYDKEKNPEGMKLPGLELSVKFESGQLNGREFKLTYHENTQEYEINFVQEGTLIIPGTVSLIPTDGDHIILFNIRMPEECKKSAQIRLAEALQEEINKQKEDRDSRTFPSNPVAFLDSSLDMSVGQAVTYNEEGKSLSTRVLKVEKQLDIPAFQTITIGEVVIKGNTKELKEEVINANQNIDTVKALSDLNKAITDGYGRVQKLILESIAQYKGLWNLSDNGFPNDPSKWTLNTDYTAFSKGDFVAYSEGIEGLGLPVATYEMFGLFKGKLGGGLLQDENNCWYIDPAYAGGGGGGGTDVNWGVSAHTNYALLTVGTDPAKDVALFGHGHDDYVLKDNTKWGTVSNYAAVLSVQGRSETVALNGHNHDGEYMAKNAVSWGSVSVDFAELYVSDRAYNLSRQGHTHSQYIKDANKNITTLYDSGDNRQYLAGDGRFYTISHTEINGLSANYVTLDTIQTITGQKTFTESLISHGDVIAYSEGIGGQGLPVASYEQYGLVRVDNSTIRMDGYGRLYVANSSGSSELVSFVNLPTGGTVFKENGRDIGVKLSGGNGIIGWHETDGIGNLFFNYQSDYKNVQIDKDCNISLPGYVNCTNGNGTVIKTAAGCKYRVDVDYTDAKIYVDGSKHFQYYSGSDKLIQMQMGWLWAHCNWTIGSDIRDKNKISDIVNVLDNIQKLNVFRFKYKNNLEGPVYIGVSAQEVKEVYSDLVSYDEYRDRFGVDYSALGCIALQGVKELYTKHLSLEQRVAKLEGGAA